MSDIEIHWFGYGLMVIYVASFFFTIKIADKKNRLTNNVYIAAIFLPLFSVIYISIVKTSPVKEKKVISLVAYTLFAIVLTGLYAVVRFNPFDSRPF